MKANPYHKSVSLIHIRQNIFRILHIVCFLQFLILITNTSHASTTTQNLSIYDQGPKEITLGFSSNCFLNAPNNLNYIFRFNEHIDEQGYFIMHGQKLVLGINGSSQTANLVLSGNGHQLYSITMEIPSGSQEGYNLLGIIYQNILYQYYQPIKPIPDMRDLYELQRLENYSQNTSSIIFKNLFKIRYQDKKYYESFEWKCYSNNEVPILKRDFPQCAYGDFYPSDRLALSLSFDSVENPNTSQGPWGRYLNSGLNQFKLRTSLPKEGSIEFWVRGNGDLGHDGLFWGYEHIRSQPGFALSLVGKRLVRLSLHTGMQWETLLSREGKHIPSHEWTHIVSTWGRLGQYIFIDGMINRIDLNQKGGLNFDNGILEIFGVPKPAFWSLDEVRIMNIQLFPDGIRWDKTYIPVAKKD